MVNIKVKKKPPKKSHTIIAGIGISFLVGGYLGQLVRRALDFFNINSRKTFAMDPFTALKVSVTTVEGIFCTLAVGVVLVGLGIYYSKKGIFDADPNDDRNFRVSDQGTYGTANFATRENLEDKYDILPCEKTKGTILGMIDEKGLETVSRPDYSTSKVTGIRLNPNIAVFGSAGSGKSYSLIRPAILQSCKNNESMIITDPKGEMYKDTSFYLRQRGYNVKVFNLLDIATSDAWNCFKDIEAEGDPVTMAQILSETIIRNTSGKGGGERFWDEAEKNLLTALTLLVYHNSSKEYGDNRGLGTVYAELTTTSLASMKAKMNDLPSNHEAKAPFNLFLKSGESVQNSVMTGLGGRLQVFQNENVRHITSNNEIDLSLPGKEKCAYFLIMSDQDSTFTFLSSLFFSFLFIRLVNYAYSCPSGSLPVKVNLLLDEFCNCGVIPDFDRKISTVRSRNISMMLIMQNLPQLKSRYPHEAWEEILGNCDIQICLGCNDKTTATYVSETSGIMTIDVSTIRTTRQTVPIMEMHPEYQRSSGVGKRNVLNPDEVRRMDKSKLILMTNGANVSVINKFNYKLLPESALLIPADPRRHMPAWRKRELEQQAKQPSFKNSPFANKTGDDVPPLTQTRTENGTNAARRHSPGAKPKSSTSGAASQKMRNPYAAPKAVKSKPKASEQPDAPWERPPITFESVGDHPASVIEKPADFITEDPALMPEDDARDSRTFVADIDENEGEYDHDDLDSDNDEVQDSSGYSDAGNGWSYAGSVGDNEDS